MNEPNVLIIQLETGQKVLVQAETPVGPLSARGEVIYVGSHHFRVQCRTPLAQDDFRPGQELKVSLAEKSGMLPVTTHFIRILENNPRILILKLPSGKWQQNRRDFFRGTVEAKITIFRSNGTKISGKTINMSGGGALIETDVPLEMNEEIQIAVEFSGGESVGSRARVVRTSESQSGEETGIKFMDISNRDQNYICRLVLVDEFENRRAEIRELTGRTVTR
ncbi:MAG: PilZ domain-containing protein [Proteobacteria bacterium]|nr:PilZ domain-containing protein [Pseudomonadota bacterium]